MSIKAQIEQDIKQAMLAGDKSLVTTLRGLKSAILYVEVAKGQREHGLSDTELIDVLSKEAKKRQESADMYEQGGSPERAEAEKSEKTVIEKYLPTQLTEAEISQLVSEAISELGATDKQAMGQVIGLVKQRSQGAADGALIAKLTQEKLAS